MTTFVIHDTSGQIVGYGRSSGPPMHPPEGLQYSDYTGDTPTRTSWWDGTQIVERPAIEAVTLPLTVDQDWVVANVPDGTEVFIAGTLAGTTTGGLTLAFPSAGSWPVRLDPPWPWIGLDVILEVTA